MTEKRNVSVPVTTPANSCQESLHVNVSVRKEPFDIPPRDPEPGTLGYYLTRRAARQEAAQ